MGDISKMSPETLTLEFSFEEELKVDFFALLGDLFDFGIGLLIE